VAAKKSAHNVALGETMRSARREQGDSQEALAGRIGLDRSYYGAIERGGLSPTVDTVAKVATGLGLSLGDLLMRVACSSRYAGADSRLVQVSRQFATYGCYPRLPWPALPPGERTKASDFRGFREADEGVWVQDMCLRW